MTLRRCLLPTLLTGLAATAALTAVPAHATTPRTWSVSADAAPGGNGSARRPFATLAKVQAVSAPGDRIRILPARKVLAGGIALKRGQILEGAGPDVRTLAATAKAPALTNGSDTRLSGDAVRLADNAVVRNLRIAGARRGAVYGKDVSGVRIIGNDVSGQNASCTRGFLIPQFNAPTNLPGIGIPIAGGLPNGWAGIMVDANSRRGGTVYVAGNVVHHAECGDGIDVRISGTASYTATIRRNRIHHLRQSHKFKSLLAIGLQSRESGRLRATVSDNTQTLLGNDDDLPLVVTGSDSEGVFANAVGPSYLDVLVTGNRYTNPYGWGSFSANGLEMVTMGKGAHNRVVIRDSYFSGSPGDVIEEGALGSDATLEMVLERVVAERSTGIGNTAVVPFNNGDCLLAGSLGARNTVKLTVRDSVLRDCSNNGLAIGSNVTNGGWSPTTAISLDVARTRITGNRGGNLGIRNFTGLRSLRVKVQDSDLAGSSSLGSSIADASFEDLGWTGSSVIDLGGGALGSTGGNCLRGGIFAADVIGYRVAAKHNWWSQPGGPGLLRTFTLGGTLDTDDALDTKPSRCH